MPVRRRMPVMFGRGLAIAEHERVLGVGNFSQHIAYNKVPCQWAYETQWTYKMGESGGVGGNVGLFHEGDTRGGKD